MFNLLFKKKPKKWVPGEPVPINKRLSRMLPGEFNVINHAFSLNAFDFDKFNIQGIKNIPALNLFLKNKGNEIFTAMTWLLVALVYWSI